MGVVGGAARWEGLALIPELSPCSPVCLSLEPPVLVVSGLDDQQVVVGDKVELEVEVSEEGAQVIW